MSQTKREQPNESLVRISKLMSEQGLCSRREADQHILNGLVLVNGQIVKELGTKVPADSKIELLKIARTNQEELFSIILNKPIGYVSNLPEKDYLPAIKLLTPENFYSESLNKDTKSLFEKFKIAFQKRKLNKLAVCGRLDIDSQGLLLFSQDGRIAKKIIGENSNIEKEYLVRVGGNLPNEKLKLLQYGLALDGKSLKPAVVEWVNKDQLRFILKEGKKRQIRRMCELVQLEVKGLKRVRIGKITLSHLPEGQWRFLSTDEINTLI